MNRRKVIRHDFSARQGQYLAFIHSYTFVNGRPPAQSDIARFFRVTPPTMHQMILTLGKAGLISRQPAATRAITVLVDPAKLPDFAPGYGEPVKTSVLRY